MNQLVNIIKQSILIVFIACFLVQTTLAQGIEEINCSGILQENGQLITGSRNLTFSIEDTDWTQTITNVPIQEGVYSVKLDAPASDFLSLYLENKQANLEISVDGTPLTPTTTMLWVPYALIAKTAIDTQKIAGYPVSGTPQENFVLKWDGNAWIPSPDQTGDSGITTESDPLWSKASSSYYNITELQTSGNAQVHWDNLNNVPSDIKDGDNVGLTGLSGHNATELDDINSSGSGSIISDAERNKLNGIETSADKTDAQNVASAGAVMDSNFSSNGIMKRTGSGTYSALDASSGRSFLGLGSAAIRNVEDTLTNGSNLPDGAAIVNYVTNQIPETSNFVNVSSEQSINAPKTFNALSFFNSTVQIGNTSGSSSLKIYSNYDAIILKKQDGVTYGEINSNSNYDFILNCPRSGGNIRSWDDLYLQGSSTSNWSDLHCGEVRAHDYIKFYDGSSQVGGFGITSSYVYYYDQNDTDFQIRTNLHISGNNDDQYMSFGATNSEYIRFVEGNYNRDLDIIMGSGSYEGDGKLKIRGYIETTQSYAYKPGGGSWSSSSDVRLKDIKKNFDRGLDAIESISTIVYNYKQDNPLGLPSEKEFVGVTAQGIQKAIPEAVEEDEYGYLVVNNDPIIWTMLNSIKQLSSQNKDLKNENESLKQELSQIKEMIAEIQQSLILN